jgi:hypothetical protein
MKTLMKKYQNMSYGDFLKYLINNYESPQRIALDSVMSAYTILANTDGMQPSYDETMDTSVEELIEFKNAYPAYALALINDDDALASDLLNDIEDAFSEVKVSHTEEIRTTVGKYTVKYYEYPFEDYEYDEEFNRDSDLIHWAINELSE